MPRKKKVDEIASGLEQIQVTEAKKNSPEQTKPIRRKGSKRKSTETEVPVVPRPNVDVKTYCPEPKENPLYELTIETFLDKEIPREEAWHGLSIMYNKIPNTLLEVIPQPYKQNALKLHQYISFFTTKELYFTDVYDKFIQSFPKWNTDEQYILYMQNITEKGKFEHTVIMDTNLVIRYDYVVVGRENKDKAHKDILLPLQECDYIFCKKNSIKFIGKGGIEYESGDEDEEGELEDILDQDRQILYDV